MIQQKIDSSWQMRRVGDEAFSPAVVPGSVYTDLLRNGQMEDPFFKDNELKALKLMDEDYEYVTSFDCEEAICSSDRKVLRFDGIDTIADVYLNGEMIGSPDNMHRTWEYDVTEEVKEKDNELRIVFHSPTKYIAEAFKVSKTHGSEDAMEGFVNIRKAHCMFGWDWGAHLPDAGLFRPVTLLGVDEARIDSVYVTQEHANGKVTLHFAVDVDCCPEMEDPSGMWNAETEEVSENEADPQESGLYYTVKVTAPDGTQVHATGSPEQLVIENPQLWWPNGYGRQDLYTVEVTLCFEGKELDCWKRRIGLRTMTVDRSKNEWGENFAICVNGMDIFAMGADYNQTLKAVREAESYNGPSVIIAYSPCINHGIKNGMSTVQDVEKRAVAAGYWSLFRYDPRLKEQGKNPFMLDSKAPSASYRDFLMSEVRYNALTRSFPDRAELLFTEAEEFAMDKYQQLVKLAQG